jgi:hypothetical protein
MSLVERIDELKAEHRSLDAAIDEENSRPLPDDVVIHTLKKRKLRIKDELASMS